MKRNSNEGMLVALAVLAVLLLAPRGPRVTIIPDNEPVRKPQ